MVKLWGTEYSESQFGPELRSLAICTNIRETDEKCQVPFKVFLRIEKQDLGNSGSFLSFPVANSCCGGWVCTASAGQVGWVNLCVCDHILVLRWEVEGEEVTVTFWFWSLILLVLLLFTLMDFLPADVSPIFRALFGLGFLSLLFSTTLFIIVGGFDFVWLLECSFADLVGLYAQAPNSTVWACLAYASNGILREHLLPPSSQPRSLF